jgi:hypothetical protein
VALLGASRGVRGAPGVCEIIDEMNRTGTHPILSLVPESLLDQIKE